MASIDELAAAIGICGIAPWAMQIADEARKNGELLERAMGLTGKTAKEIRALAAESPLCFADFVATLAIPPPIVAPFLPVAPPPPSPTRFRIRYGVAYCLRCDLACAYCMCARTSPDAESPDGDASSLRKRIAEVKR